MRLLLLLLCLLLSFRSHGDDLKKIAITLDDVPMESGRVFKGLDRTKRIIQTLKDSDVKVGLFVIGINLTRNNGERRLEMYDEAGHMIGNHTYSHVTCRKTDDKKFIENIKKCHGMISSYENFRPFFRFPYLDECKQFSKKNKNVENILNELGYKKAFVTIVTIDWYFNSLLQKALRNGKNVNYDNLKELYLQMVLEAVKKHDESLISLIGYRPVHNLLFHENDITALYLGDVIEMLRDNGWTIVDPEEAFADQNLSNRTQKISYNANSIIPYYKKLFYIKVIE
jgi:peptidoglycan/xylan/chitin deacetylase (PgdA/CDA1 family)